MLGAESTGKTWLCENLARHYNTVWVPEYAREYFNDSDIYNYTLEDLVKIAMKQMLMEDTGAKKANSLLFCDTNLITLKIWAELEFNSCPEQILKGLRTRNYDLFLLTENDVEWQVDPLRQNKHSRDKLLRLNKEEVIAAGKPYFVINGEGDKRLKNAVDAINSVYSV